MCQKVRECSKNAGGMLKGHKSLHEGTPTGQIWGNLSIEINNGSKGIESIE